MGGKVIPAPSPGDLLLAARALDWPAVEAGGHVLGPGEGAWRASVAALDEDGRRAFWSGWGAQSSNNADEDSE